MADSKPEVLRLAEVIDYQDGSVVSQEIMKKQAGTVTLFAFDEGQGLSEHTAPFDAAVQVLDGVAEVSISGTAHTVEAGGLIVMPAGEPHSLKAPARFKMLLIMIRS
jgi:quercetin dioxygenase-like cupin family protein